MHGDIWLLLTDTKPNQQTDDLCPSCFFCSGFVQRTSDWLVELLIVMMVVAPWEAFDSALWSHHSSDGRNPFTGNTMCNSQRRRGRGVSEWEKLTLCWFVWCKSALCRHSTHPNTGTILPNAGAITQQSVSCQQASGEEAWHTGTLEKGNNSGADKTHADTHPHVHWHATCSFFPSIPFRLSTGGVVRQHLDTQRPTFSKAKVTTWPLALHTVRQMHSHRSIHLTQSYQNMKRNLDTITFSISLS